MPKVYFWDRKKRNETKRIDWSVCRCVRQFGLECPTEQEERIVSNRVLISNQIALVCVFSKKNSRRFLVVLLINNLPLHQIVLITCKKKGQAKEPRTPCNEKKAFCEHMPTIYCLFCFSPCIFFAPSRKKNPVKKKSVKEEEGKRRK